MLLAVLVDIHIYGCNNQIVLIRKYVSVLVEWTSCWVCHCLPYPFCPNLPTIILCLDFVLASEQVFSIISLLLSMPYTISTVQKSIRRDIPVSILEDSCNRSMKISWSLGAVTLYTDMTGLTSTNGGAPLNIQPLYSVTSELLIRGQFLTLAPRS